jgi:hypothetical protein
MGEAEVVAALMGRYRNLAEKDRLAINLGRY